MRLTQDAFPMGAQDTDLVLRVVALKRGHKKRVKNKDLSQAILNSNDARHVGKRAMGARCGALKII